MLKHTHDAIQRMEQQFVNAVKLDTNHLAILATGLGRFNDEFLLYHHELELRKALSKNSNIDVSYAREKMREFAWGIIDKYKTRELILTHKPAVYNPLYVPNRDNYEKELSKTNRIKRYHKQIIDQLLNKSVVTC